MSYRRLIATLALLIAASGLFGGAAARAAGADVLIVYADRSMEREVAMMQQLVAHFEPDSEAMLLEEATDEQLRQAGAVIYLDDRILGAAREAAYAEQRFRDRDGTLLWIGYGDFHNPLNGIAVRYRDETYGTHRLQTADLTAFVDERTVRLAEVSDGSREAPLVMRQQSRWYVAANPFVEPLLSIVTDLLHEVIGGDSHSWGHYGLMKIENVHPLVDPKRLQAIGERLAARGIPFVVSVIPLYTNPETGDPIDPYAYPEWIEAVRGMVEAGGTVVLDAFAHRHLSERQLGGQLEREIAILSRIGLYPIAYERIDGPLSSARLDTVGGIFSTLIGKVPLYDGDSAAPRLAFTWTNADGVRIYPMSLDYTIDEFYHVDVLMKRWQHLRIIRDAFVGIEFDPAVDPDKLQELLDRLAPEAIYWLDMRSVEHRVTSDAIRLQTGGDGTLDVVVPDAEALSSLAEIRNQNRMLVRGFAFYLTWILAILVSVFVMLFIWFVIYLRRRRKYRLFQEREGEDSS